MRIEQVAEAIYRLEEQLPGARYIFSVYLIDENEGVLIEPGPTSMVPTIQEGMKRLGIHRLSYIIPTHIHMDHGGGVGKLAALFPQAKVVFHPRAVRHALNPSRLTEATKMAYGDDFESTYGPILPVPESQILSVEDGEIMRINARELQIMYTPGHAPHQIAIFDRKTGGLFCGEALGVPIPGDGSFALPSISVQDFNPDLYLETIERLKRLAPRVLFYSHDGGVRMPEKLITSLAENTQVLRDTILEGLRNGETIESIIPRVSVLLSGYAGKGTGTMSSIEETVLGYTTYFSKKGLI